jgi:antitoxin VapB
VALNIKHPEADRLARDLARRRRQSITEAVVHALRAELAREVQRIRAPGMADELLEIGKRYAALRTYDERSEDEILGYDEHGIPS